MNANPDLSGIENANPDLSGVENANPHLSGIENANTDRKSGIRKKKVQKNGAVFDILKNMHKKWGTFCVLFLISKTAPFFCTFFFANS